MEMQKGNEQLPAIGERIDVARGLWGGASFKGIKEARTNCTRLQGESFHLVAPDSIDRLYYGTVDGAVVLLPLGTSIQPNRVALKPLSLQVPGEPQPVEFYEVNGIKLDYAGRVWVVNAAGLFVFDQYLSQCLFFMPDNRPVQEKIHCYEESVGRIQTDYNRRYVFWLLAGGIIRTIDTSTCQPVGPDYQFNRDATHDLVEWRVSPDGQCLYALLENEDTLDCKLEVHSLPNRSIIPHFTLFLPSHNAQGDIEYSGFAVDFNKGLLVVLGISPPNDRDDSAEDDEDYEEEPEDDLRDKELVVQTYQLEASRVAFLNVQRVNQLDKKFYPAQINGCMFPELEGDNGSGAGTLITSILGGKKALRNSLFVCRWDPASRTWSKQVTLQKHHQDQQLGWELRGNLLFTSAADSTLSLISFG